MSHILDIYFFFFTVEQTETGLMAWQMSQRQKVTKWAFVTGTLWNWRLTLCCYIPKWQLWCNYSDLPWQFQRRKGNFSSSISNIIFRMGFWVLCRRQRVVDKKSREFEVKLHLNPESSYIVSEHSVVFLCNFIKSIILYLFVWLSDVSPLYAPRFLRARVFAELFIPRHNTELGT